MDYNLNIWERAICLAIIGAVRGDAARIRKATKILDALEFTKDEEDKFGIYYPQEGVIGWNQTLTEESTDISINDKEANLFFRATVSGYDNFPSMPKGFSIRLLDKVGNGETEVKAPELAS